MVRTPTAAKDSKKKKAPTKEAITTVPPAVPTSVDATATNVPPAKSDNANATSTSAIKKTTAQTVFKKPRTRNLLIGNGFFRQNRSHH